MKVPTVWRNIVLASVLLLPAACAFVAVPNYLTPHQPVEACAFSCTKHDDGKDWLVVTSMLLGFAVMILWAWLVNRLWKSGKSD